jgi:hypothetical protein
MAGGEFREHFQVMMMGGTRHCANHAVTAPPIDLSRPEVYSAG